MEGKTSVLRSAVEILYPSLIKSDASSIAFAYTLLSTTFLNKAVVSKTGTPAPINIPNVLQNLFKIDCSIKAPKTGILNNKVSRANPPL